MFKKTKTSELLIFGLVIVLIFISEYEYLILENPMRAIFIGLWPPTIMSLLNYINIKRKQ